MRGYEFAADFETKGKSEDELEEHDAYVNSQSSQTLSMQDIQQERVCQQVFSL